MSFLTGSAVDVSGPASESEAEESRWAAAFVGRRRWGWGSGEDSSSDSGCWRGLLVEGCEEREGVEGAYRASFSAEGRHCGGFG